MQHELIENMRQLKLFGMVSAFDEIVLQGIKRNQYHTKNTPGIMYSRSFRSESTIHKLSDAYCQVPCVKRPGHFFL